MDLISCFQRRCLHVLMVFVMASLVDQWLRIWLQCRRHGFDPCVRKLSWGRTGKPPPVLLPGESHGQRSLAGYSPWGLKESDTPEGT